ncbi:MAG TPA: MarR family transcriptional regulator [Streptosporangiaceae bacterium]
MQRPGFELPVLLAGAFREIIDDLHAELDKHGHGEARPLHGFALQAIGPDGATLSELGRRLGVSKQAAAKTAAGLEEIGYITRRPSTQDGRAVVLTRTPRGEEMLNLSAAIFEQIRRTWVRRLGQGRVAAIEDGLAEIVAGSGRAKIGDLPGWIR